MFMAVILFFYGLAFFSMGLALALETSHQPTNPLAAPLRWLAAFGLTHSLVEWMDMARSIGMDADYFLLVRIGLLGLSTVLLVEFGARVLISTDWQIPWLRFISRGLAAVWGVSLLAGVIPGLVPYWFIHADAWTRYLLYFPGCILSALGLVRQSRRFAESGLPDIARDSRLAAAAFAINSVAAGIIVGPSPYLPASLINSDLFLTWTGVPIQVVRATAAITIAFLITRTLRAFEVERQRLLAASQAAALQAEERARRQAEEIVAQRTAELQERNRELAALTQRYRALFEAANDAIYVHDLQGHFLEVNEVACRRLGYTRDELLTMSVQDIDTPSMAARFDQGVALLLKTGSGFFETEHVCKDGRVLSIELSTRVIDVGGQKLIMSLARDVTERKRQQAELVARSQQIAALQATLQERERISREMHDGLAQVLGYIGYKIHAIADMLQKGDIAQARAGLHEVGGVARSAYADIREAILGLRTSITPDIGLMACLKEYMVRFQREWGIQTELIVEEGVPTSFPPATEVQLLRIIQEAMTNIRKHAEARRAVVRFARMGDHTSVIIQDDGKGFDPATVPGQHYGLATMWERAQLVNANLKIETGPNQGTRVIIGLPNGDGMVQEV